MHPMIGIGLAMVGLGLAAGVATAAPGLRPTAEVRAAYDAMVAAEDWRDAAAARDRLLAHGEDALGVILEGTHEEKRVVRDICYVALRDRFPDNLRAQRAMVEGLRDGDPGIRYICAFHLGTRPDVEPADALRNCIADPGSDIRTRYAAAKSLAELGDADVTPLLYIGLGNEDSYVRYASNVGIHALAGKDLGDFGYESPWEGALVSGFSVYQVKGQPIEEATHRVERWTAIRAFAEWLASDRPDLFRSLKDSWLQESWILDELGTPATASASAE